MDAWVFKAVDKAVKTTLRRMGLGGDHDAYQDGWEKALWMLRRYKPIQGNQEALLVRYLNMGLGLKIAREHRHRTRPICYYLKDVDICAVPLFDVDVGSDDLRDRIIDAIELKQRLSRLSAYDADLVEQCLMGQSMSEVSRLSGVPRPRIRRAVANATKCDTLSKEEK